MRIFQALVFDDTLDSSTPLYIDPSFNDELGSMDEVSISGVAVALSGTGPTLSVQIEESPNQIHWRNKGASPEINAAALSLTTFTNVQGRDAGTVPASGFLRLRVEVGGTTPRVHVKLWVAVRAEQRGQHCVSAGGRCCGECGSVASAGPQKKSRSNTAWA